MFPPLCEMERLFSPRVLQNMQTCAGPVRYIDQPAVIQVHIIRLNHLFQARLGLLRRGGNVVPHFLRFEGIGDIDHPQAPGEIGDIDEGAPDDRSVFGFGKLVRAESASPLAEITVRNLKSGDWERVGLLRCIQDIKLFPDLLAAILRIHGLLCDHQKIPHVPEARGEIGNLHPGEGNRGMDPGERGREIQMGDHPGVGFIRDVQNHHISALEIGEVGPIAGDDRMVEAEKLAGLRIPWTLSGKAPVGDKFGLIGILQIINNQVLAAPAGGYAGEIGIAGSASHQLLWAAINGPIVETRLGWARSVTSQISNPVNSFDSWFRRMKSFPS